jgi:hypothetical protein
MTPADTLRAAKALIEKPENWHVGYYAKTPGGDDTWGDLPQACKWCALGALQKVSGDPYFPIGRRDHVTLEAAARKLGYDCASLLNDTTDHATVMRMFDLAIEMAEEE